MQSMGLPIRLLGRGFMAPSLGDYFMATQLMNSVMPSLMFPNKVNTLLVVLSI